MAGVPRAGGLARPPGPRAGSDKLQCLSAATDCRVLYRHSHVISATLHTHLALDRVGRDRRLRVRLEMKSLRIAK